MAAWLNTMKCTKETCSFHFTKHAGCRDFGHLYDAAAIPHILAERVAKYVDSTLFEKFFFLNPIGSPSQVTVTPEEEAEFNARMSE